MDAITLGVWHMMVRCAVLASLILVRAAMIASSVAPF